MTVHEKNKASKAEMYRYLKTVTFTQSLDTDWDTLIISDGDVRG